MSLEAVGRVAGAVPMGAVAVPAAARASLLASDRSLLASDLFTNGAWDARDGDGTAAVGEVLREVSIAAEQQAKLLASSAGLAPAVLFCAPGFRAGKRHKSPLARRSICPQFATDFVF
jgi:hypothetical protein